MQYHIQNTDPLSRDTLTLEATNLEVNANAFILSTEGTAVGVFPVHQYFVYALSARREAPQPAVPAGEDVKVEDQAGEVVKSAPLPAEACPWQLNDRVVLPSGERATVTGNPDPEGKVMVLADGKRRSHSYHWSRLAAPPAGEAHAGIVSAAPSQAAKSDDEGGRHVADTLKTSTEDGITVGDKVLAADAKGRVLEGKVVEVDGTTVTMRTGKKEVTVESDKVFLAPDQTPEPEEAITDGSSADELPEPKTYTHDEVRIMAESALKAAHAANKKEDFMLSHRKTCAQAAGKDRAQVADVPANMLGLVVANLAKWIRI